MWHVVCVYSNEAHCKLLRRYSVPLPLLSSMPYEVVWRKFSRNVRLYVQHLTFTVQSVWTGLSVMLGEDVTDWLMQVHSLMFTYLLLIVDYGHLWSVWTTCIWQWETGKGLSGICCLREAYCWRIWLLASAWQDTARLVACRATANTADNKKTELCVSACVWTSWT